MSDESSFDFEFDTQEEEVEESLKKEIFISDVLGPRGHLINTHSSHGTLRILHFKCVAKKNYDEGSRFILFKVPQSQVRVLGALSQIVGSVPEFSVGWASFQNRHRERKDGSANGCVKMASAGKPYTFFTNALLNTVVFDSIEGVEVYATAHSNGVKGDEIRGYIVYVKK